MMALASTGETSRVQYGTTLLEYQIKRSGKRNTVSIAIVPEEGLVVTAPPRATKERLDELVRKKAAWITKRLKRQSDLPLPMPEKDFLSGETFKYLGRQYRLKVESSEPKGIVRLHGAYLCLSLEKDQPEDSKRQQARAALVKWYRGRAKEYLPRRALLWAPKLALEAPRILISEPEKRWGSASKDGTVRINWRVLQAPVTIVDYVLVHELAHLIHEDHGREFWATVGRVMPDYEERKKRLRAMGVGLVW